MSSPFAILTTLTFLEQKLKWLVSVAEISVHYHQNVGGIIKTYFCELRRLDLSLVFKQFSSFAIVICRFFSGNSGDGIDLGVLGVVGAGDADLKGGGARVRGGGANVIGGKRAFSAPS